MKPKTIIIGAGEAITEEEEGRLMPLFTLAKKAIVVGQKRLGAVQLIVRGDTLYIETMSANYLAIRPFGHNREVFFTDLDFVREGTFTIDSKIIDENTCLLEKHLIKKGVIQKKWF